MSAVTAPSNILLTGGTGFLGSTILADLLKQGFNVRAAVRSMAKAAPLESTFKPYVDSGTLTFFVVPDITVDGAFLTALQGVDGVIHSAAPLPSADPNADPSENIDPAVNGVLTMLADAARVPSVKRVVMTSSAITLPEPKQGKYVYTEVDWFDTAPKLVEKLGASANPVLKYAAAKVLAERAAWQWIEKNKPSYHFVTVLPPWIWGRSILSSLDHFRPQSSNELLLSAVYRGYTGELEEKDYLKTNHFIDVLDASEGHVKALTNPEVNGQRLIIVGGRVVWQDVFDILNSNPVPGFNVPRGNVGSGKTFPWDQTFGGERAAKLLEMKYRPAEETIRDMVVQAVELGWVEKVAAK